MKTFRPEIAPKMHHYDRRLKDGTVGNPDAMTRTGLRLQHSKIGQVQKMSKMLF